MFRVIIAGGRDFYQEDLLVDYVRKVLGELDQNNRDVVLVCGMAKGADQIGFEMFQRRKLRIAEYPAEWHKYGPSAGHRRNAQMAKVGDILIAAWDGESKGTAGMIKLMEKAGKPVYILEY